MNKIVALLLLSGVWLCTPLFARQVNEPYTEDGRAVSHAPSGLPTVVRTAWDIVWEGEGAFRHGNWYGPGWWGGSLDSNRVGMLAPIDSLDAVAQRHDFGYLVAETMGKGNPALIGYYMAIADKIAADEAAALPKDPALWPHPPVDAKLAGKLRDRIAVGFDDYYRHYNAYSASEQVRKSADLNTFKANQIAEVAKWNKQYAQWQIDKAEKNKNTPAQVKTDVKPAVQQGGTSTSLKLELPGYWGHLGYAISGAQLDPPIGSDRDRGKVGGRQYKGKLAGKHLVVTGSAVSDNTSSGPGSGDYYELVVEIAAGKETKYYGYIAPKGEKLNKPFSLSVPIDPSATSGSFSIRLMEQNRNYGPHGWVVTGTLSK